MAPLLRKEGSFFSRDALDHATARLALASEKQDFSNREIARIGAKGNASFHAFRSFRVFCGQMFFPLSTLNYLRLTSSQ